MYFGVIELESPPYLAVVRVTAQNAETAKLKYEKYCDEIGGYIVQLYPVNDEIIKKFGVAYKNAKTI